MGGDVGSGSPFGAFWVIFHKRFTQQRRQRGKQGMPSRALQDSSRRCSNKENSIVLQKAHPLRIRFRISEDLKCLNFFRRVSEHLKC